MTESAAISMLLEYGIIGIMALLAIRWGMAERAERQDWQRKYDKLKLYIIVKDLDLDDEILADVSLNELPNTDILRIGGQAVDLRDTIPRVGRIERQAVAEVDNE